MCVALIRNKIVKFERYASLVFYSVCLTTCGRCEVVH